MKDKIVVRQHPLVKDWEVAWEVKEGEWKRGIFKTKKKAMEFEKWIKKVKKSEERMKGK